MGNDAYSKRLRVAGNVVPGSIKRTGTPGQFLLKEETLTLPVSYTGTEAPPDTFKDDSQPSPMAGSDAMVFSTPSSSRPSARQRMRPNRVNPEWLPPARPPGACRKSRSSGFGGISKSAFFPKGLLYGEA